MPKANLKQQAVTLIEQLLTEKLSTAIDYLTYLYDKAAWMQHMNWQTILKSWKV